MNCFGNPSANTILAPLHIHLALKKALLRMLARDVKYFDIHLFSDSGLCLGQILNQMEEHTRAVQAFEPLLDIYPYEPPPAGPLCQCSLASSSESQAKLNYIKAWMIAPSIVISLPVKDEEFGQLIFTEGPYMAPIYEWIRKECRLWIVLEFRGEFRTYGGIENL